MEKCRILLPYSCRSDTALTQPIINRLEKEEWCDLTTIPLVPANYLESFKIIEKHISLCKYDLIYLTGDRVEMGAVAQCAFLNSLKIVHYGGGITNTIATFDDIIRHQISLVADIELCEDYNSATIVKNLWINIEKIKSEDYYLRKLLMSGSCDFELREKGKELDKEYNIHIVGNLYLEDLPELDFSLCPSEPYDLILYNPPTILDFQLQKKDMLELYEIRKSIKNTVIFLDPNPDPKGLFLPVTFPNLERSKFLGLLSKCSRYITNSSSSVYEAPLYLKPEQIIRVGLRNSNRSSNFEEMKKYPNTANIIIEIIKNWWFKRENEK